MDTTEKEQRDAVIAEARTWLGTPYRLNAEVKGGGVDCGRFLVACFTGTGLVEAIEYGAIQADFNLHRNDEIYLRWILKYCAPVPEPEPGDIALFKRGRIISHGALVVNYPKIIHATPRGVLVGSAKEPDLQNRLAGFYSFWRKAP